ncbi:hypothetical protein GGR57DRAFT_499568 [Xylariaceae sp. FL1272]|nr:hypothetical protein GGR57DRAFT_499568 [Xylariaceae sp. FL1272]
MYNNSLSRDKFVAHQEPVVYFHIDKDAETSKKWAQEFMKPSVFGPKFLAWSDGSVNQDDHIHGGAGVHWVRLDGLDTSWITKYGGQESFGIHGEGDLHPGVAEILALYCALSIAFWEVQDWLQQKFNQTTLGNTKPRRAPPVTVLTDSKEAINYFRARHHRQTTPLPDVPANWYHELLRPLHSLLSIGCHVTIRWVKGHSGMEGNERANSLATAGRLFGQQVPRDIGVQDGISLFSLSALLSHGVLQHIPSLVNIWDAKITIPASSSTSAETSLYNFMLNQMSNCNVSIGAFVKGEVEKIIAAGTGNKASTPHPTATTGNLHSGGVRRKKETKRERRRSVKILQKAMEQS